MSPKTTPSAETPRVDRLAASARRVTVPTAPLDKGPTPGNRADFHGISLFFACAGEAAAQRYRWYRGVNVATRHLRGLALARAAADRWRLNRSKLSGWGRFRKN